MMRLAAKGKRRNGSNPDRNDLSPVWSILAGSETNQAPNPCVPTVNRQGFETDDTHPPSTAESADVSNFDSTLPPLPNAFEVRTRVTLPLPDMACAVDLNLILSLRNWSTALISVRVHVALKIITPYFHNIQTNIYFWTFPIVVGRFCRTALIC